MGAHPDYSAAWRDYRRRRFISLALALSYLPGAMAIFLAVGLPLTALTGIHPDYFGFAIGVSWMIALVIAGIRLQTFSCPRCRKWFFATWWYRNPFARKCVHCGLPKWATSDVTLRIPPQSN
jgi:hypothetical protein